MKPIVLTQQLDDLYGEREFYLTHRVILDKGLTFVRGLEIRETGIVFADAIEETLEHFFCDGGEFIMPLVCDGQLMDDPKYYFSLQGYEIYHEPNNYYLGMIVLYYKSIHIDEVMNLFAGSTKPSLVS